MTTLLPRAKTDPFLALLLSALLAWPASLPISSPGPSRPAPITARSAARSVGVTLKQGDRKAYLVGSDWSDIVDNAEGTDVRDDHRCLMPAMADRRLNLPSLIPSSFVSQPAPTSDEITPFNRSIPLRC